MLQLSANLLVRSWLSANAQFAYRHRSEGVQAGLQAHLWLACQAGLVAFFTSQVAHYGQQTYRTHGWRVVIICTACQHNLPALQVCL